MSFTFSTQPSSSYSHHECPFYANEKDIFALQNNLKKNARNVN